MSTDKDTILVVCGSNKYDQISPDPKNISKQNLSMINPPCKTKFDVSELLSYSTFCDHTIYVKKDGNAYGLGNKNFINCNSKEKVDGANEIIIRSKGEKCKIHSAVCGINYNVYIISKSNRANTLCFYNYSKDGKGYAMDINDRQPIALFGGSINAAAIDNEGAVIPITDSQFSNPLSTVDALFLPDHERAVSVACCDSFLCVLSETGRVFIVDVNDGCSLSELEDLKGKKIINISGTYKRCYAVCCDGSVFMGEELGIKPDDSSSSSVDFIICVSNFKVMENLKKYKIVAAYAGYKHSLFQTNEGKILSCGENKYGELLMNNFGDVFDSPSETCINWAASFCIAGKYLSAVFIGKNVPPNTPNKRLKNNDDLFITKNVKNSFLKSNEEEIVKLKSLINEKDNEILSLKKSIKNFEAKNLLNDEKLKKLKYEYDKVNSENNCHIKDLHELKKKYQCLMIKYDDLEKVSIRTINDSNINVKMQETYEKLLHEYEKENNRLKYQLENNNSTDEIIMLKKENNSLASQIGEFQKSLAEFTVNNENNIKKLEVEIARLLDENDILIKKLANSEKMIQQYKELFKQINYNKELSENLNVQLENEKKNNSILMDKIKYLENKKSIGNNNNNQLLPMKNKDDTFITEIEEENYETLEEIGEGATSKAYKIIDKHTSQILCKKIVKQVEDEKKFQKLQNALKEFEALNKVNHPCICKMIGYNLHENIPNDSDDEQTTVALYIEYLPYKLKDYYKNKILNSTLKTKIALEIAFGMMNIHNNNIIHRDLKIENIMLNSIFESKIIDFDQCRINDELDLTASYTKGIGTYYYVSPEIANDEDYDNSTDVYSYGITLYILFTERYPPLHFPSPSIKITKNCIELIQMCTLYDRKKRPSFAQIIDYMNSKNFLLAEDIDLEIIKNRYQWLSQLQLQINQTKNEKKSIKVAQKNVIQKPIIKKSFSKF